MHSALSCPHSCPTSSPVRNAERMARPQKMPEKSAAKQPAKRGGGALGVLPEWNLADLYAGLDDPAIKRDLDRADAECVSFEEAYKGKLAAMAASPTAGAALADAVRRY